MEHIKDILRNCPPGTDIPSRAQIPNSTNSLSNRERLTGSLGVMSLANTFKNFKPMPGTERALAAFKAVLDGPEFMLLCYGGVGNGKTHLCEAAAIELYRRGKFCRVMKMPEMLSTLRRAINNPEMDYDTVLGNYCYAERLIVDDIGAGEKSDREFSDRILERIVGARYGRQLLTIMTSNLKFEDLPERVKSRFEDAVTSYLVLNEGEDYRPKKKARKQKEKVSEN